MPQTSPTPITAAPTPAPQRNDRTTFSTRVDAFVTWLIAAVAEFNAIGTNVYNNAVDAYNNSVSAGISASTATTQASNASASASTATTKAAEALTSANNAAASAATANSAVAFVDSNSVVKGSADATKQVRFEVDGLTTGTTRVITVPDANFTLTGTETVNTWAQQQIFKETKDTVYMITDGAAFEIDPANGSVQTVTLGASRTPAATNFESGQSVILGIDNGTVYSVTWSTISPTWTKIGGSGAAPTLAATGKTWIVLWMVGSTMYASHLGDG